MNFDEAFEVLIGHEGGYVNNPADPGGATRFGVTERVARANGYTGDMKALPLEFSKKVYRASYWDSVHADQLPELLRFDVFDAAVNSGVAQAIKWLQTAIAAKPDGVMGPMTLQAAAAADRLAVARFNGVRLSDMTSMGGWPTFSKGWARRIANNLKVLHG